MTFTSHDIFELGKAWLSFRMGEIDQGIHILLPCTRLEDGVSENDVFKPLFARYFSRIPKDAQEPGDKYAEAILRFLRRNGIEVEA